jgi:hypothetical protein
MIIQVWISPGKRLISERWVAAVAWSSGLHEVMGAERQNGGKRIAD